VCSYTACYLAHTVLTQVLFGTLCVPAQHVIWHTTACYLVDSVFLHSVLFGTHRSYTSVIWYTVCSCTACYLAHTVLTQRVIWYIVCSYTACYLAHTVLTQVLFGTLCVPAQHVIWHTLF